MSSATPGDAPETTDTLLAEVDARLRLLEAGRPARLDGMAVSPVSKLPFKALQYREALIWRAAQLGRNAFEHFVNNKLASAVLLTRATVETSAALWFLRAKLEAAVESKTRGNIDDDLMRLLMGSKADTDILPAAINVLNFVDRVEKDIPGFRHQYDCLSQFAHPNWAGTTFLFSKIESGGITNFGENVRGTQSTRRIGLANLSVALAMFEVRYNQITDLMPAFISFCEQHSMRQACPGKREGFCGPERAGNALNEREAQQREANTSSGREPQASPERESQEDDNEKREQEARKFLLRESERVQREREAAEKRERARSPRNSPAVFPAARPPVPIGGQRVTFLEARFPGGIRPSSQ